MRNTPQTTYLGWWLLAGAGVCALLNSIVWWFVSDDQLRCGLAGMGWAVFLALCGAGIYFSLRLQHDGAVWRIWLPQLLVQLITLNAVVLWAYHQANQPTNEACRWVACSTLPLVIPYFTCATVASLLLGGVCVLFMFSSSRDRRRVWFWWLSAAFQIALGIAILPAALVYYSAGVLITTGRNDIWLQDVLASMPSLYTDRAVQFARRRADDHEIYDKIMKYGDVSIRAMEEEALAPPAYAMSDWLTTSEIAFRALCRTDENAALNLVLRVRSQGQPFCFGEGLAGYVMGRNASVAVLQREWTSIESKFGFGVLQGLSTKKRSDCTKLAGHLIQLMDDSHEWKLREAIALFCTFATDDGAAEFICEELERSDTEHMCGAISMLYEARYGHRNWLFDVVEKVLGSGSRKTRLMLLESPVISVYVEQKAGCIIGDRPLYLSREEELRLIAAVAPQLKVDDPALQRISITTLAYLLKDHQRRTELGEKVPQEVEGMLSAVDQQVVEAATAILESGSQKSRSELLGSLILVTTLKRTGSAHVKNGEAQGIPHEQTVTCPELIAALAKQLDDSDSVIRRTAAYFVSLMIGEPVNHPAIGRMLLHEDRYIDGEAAALKTLKEKTTTFLSERPISN